MITWMQRHKKWLVVTIWVSTIAFVSAGFFGWGSYDFGKTQGTVAKVGNKEVSIANLQSEYNSLYNQYSQIFGNQFNQEVAKRLNLEKIAFDSVIQKALLLNFADEIGLDTTDKEIADELLKIPAFKKDGKFDKSVYVQVLNQNKTNPVDFEENLRKDLLIQKVRGLFDLDVSKKEIQSFGSMLGMQDDINIEVIDSSSILVPNDETKLKEYWESHKDEYMTNAAFEIESYDYPISSYSYTDEKIKSYFEKNKIDFKKPDGKLMSFKEAKPEVIKALDSKKSKDKARRFYIKLKKGQEKFSKKEKIFENMFEYPIDDIKKIKSAKNGEVLKPFKNKDVYTIVKLINKIPPQTKPFVEVRNQVLDSYRKLQKKKILLSQAKDRLKYFKGKNFKDITMDYDKRLLSLNSEESRRFVNELFLSSKKEGMVKLDGKVVLYRINNTIISPTKNTDFSQVENLIKNSKQNELFQNLLEKLQTKYGVISYMEKGE